MPTSQDAVFVMSGEELLELSRAPYELEDDFQEQLANHPQLLGGAQFPGTSPRRWLLVDREIPIPDRQDGSGRWSLDHLFIDQDGTPTLVEVKRASDTRLRREVVGQMLDYAANGGRYWPADLLRRRWEASLAKDEDEDQVLLAFAGMSADEFWTKVSEDLAEGRIRMLFVSDDIPTELQTVIEYLNEQMSDAEAFSVSITRYIGHDLSVLVPRVVGSSVRVQQSKQAREGKSYEEHLADAGETAQLLERRLLAMAERQGLPTRRTPKALQLRTISGDRDVLQFYPGHKLQLTIDPLRKLGQDALADQILEEANRLTNESLTDKYPGIPFADALEHWEQVESMILRLAEAHQGVGVLGDQSP